MRQRQAVAQAERCNNDVPLRRCHAAARADRRREEYRARVRLRVEDHLSNGQ